MFVWTKDISPDSALEWEERLASQHGLVITAAPGRKTVRLEVWSEVRVIADQLRREHGGSVKKIPQQNWAALKPELPPPVKVRNTLLICAESDKAKLAALAKAHPQRAIISVPADLAFGTGHHATTATVLRLLSDFAAARQGTPWNLLDLGTGTGVLAIAAEKLGATDIWGCDFDPLAVAVAQKNLLRNRTRSTVIDEADVLKWKPAARYDCVAANLFCDILEAVFPKIVRSVKPGGIVLISGILKSQAKHCLAAGTRAGLHFDKVITVGKWVSARAVLQKS
jgi:ribosomal protein L11 methyltransferase